MTRRKAEYVVLRVEGRSANAYNVVADGLADTEAGRKWIKVNGQNDTTYQVAALVTPELHVCIETVEKRKLVPVE